MRPNEDILNEFYGLVELNAQKRYEAVSRLFMKVKSDPSVQEYCVERLIAGLSSTRAAARFGYSTALVLLLSEYHEQWTVEKLFEIADKKLDLHDKDSASANAIAHHLLACAIFQSGVFDGCHSALLEREFQLYRLCPTLGMTIVQLVAEIALGMEKKAFKSRVLPAIKNYLETALTSSSVEFVYLALLLKDRFPSYIADSVSFVQKDGRCSFSQDDFTFLLLTIKKCDSSAVEPFLNLLLSSARASGQFASVYSNVVEKWCTSGDESKVLERIFDTAKLTLSSGDATYDELLDVFSPLLLKRITQIARGKQNAQQRLMHGKITEFCKFTEEYLNSLKPDDTQVLKLISTLDATESFDILSGANLVDHLVGRLSQEGVAKWIQTADKRWSLRHVTAAFPQWSSEAKVEALTELVKRPKSEDIQYTVGNCIDSLFKIKVRAGELVNVTLIEGGEELLRNATDSLFGKDAVKSALKKMNASPVYKSVLPVYWMCLKLWSKIASTEQMSEGYQSNAEELRAIVKAGEEGVKVLLDQLLSLLSQPQKYHRTVIYHVYVNLLPYINEEHVAHIIETLSMDDEELADEEESEEKTSDEDEEMEEASESESESSMDDEDDIDPTTISRLESALGKAAVKRKADAIDEEESDASDVDDAEMFAMDDRLAAAFKAMAPKKENELASHMASAFRLKLADLLLFTLSSQNTPLSVKVHMMIPLLKLAKQQLKDDAEGHNSRKTIGLLNIIAKLKKAHLPDEEIVSLLDQLIQEGTGIANPTLISAVASISSFICSLGISSEGTCSETVLNAFVGLFERFMSQEEGLIGCELAIAAVVKHPEVFVPKSKVFLKAGFNAEFRIFRRTEAVLCLAGMMTKAVQHKVSAEKSVVKGIGKSCTEYLNASVAEPNAIKPRYFASVLKLILSTANGISDELKPTLQKHLSIDSLTEDESKWNVIAKKISAACQQTCGKSPSRVLNAIQNAIA